MTALISHLRSVHLRALSVALLATVFSAGLAFADGAPGPASAAAPGLENAAIHAGKTVPVRAGDDETSDEPELEEEDGENCATDPTTLTEEELAEMRHGSIVCWAAHQETPDGYDNHGQWVSEWAKAKAGLGDDEESAEVEASGEADGPGAAGRGNGKGKGRGGRP